jgi:hypothetical protein
MRRVAGLRSHCAQILQERLIRRVQTCNRIADLARGAQLRGSCLGGGKITAHDVAQNARFDSADAGRRFRQARDELQDVFRHPSQGLPRGVVACLASGCSSGDGGGIRQRGAPPRAKPLVSRTTRHFLLLLALSTRAGVDSLMANRTMNKQTESGICFPRAGIRAEEDGLALEALRDELALVLGRHRCVTRSFWSLN